MRRARRAAATLGLATLVLTATVAPATPARADGASVATPRAGAAADRSAGGTGGDAADATRRDAAPEPPRLEISTSRVANLVHWIDNLAGSSNGKTIRAYRGHWTRRYGMPSPDEMELLRAWAALRAKPVPRPEPVVLNDRGCLPQTDDVLSWRQVFLIRSYEAASIDAFAAAMAPDLTEEERASLKRVLDVFAPRFDAIWKEMTFLPLFEERFRGFVESGPLRPFLGEVAGFFGVDPSSAPAGRIHLMALPEEGATHAQADGQHLMMEIRPNDGPTEQIQVIAHETSHYLWHHLDPLRNDALARQVHEAAPEGPVVWELLREAIPTALGQGLAEARLAPRRFRFDQPWYHLDAIDRIAKEIYPAVERAVRERRRLEDGVMAEIARIAAASAPARGAAPSEYLARSFFAIGEGMFQPYRRIRERARVWSAWPSAAASEEGAAFAGRYACLSGVVLLGPGEAGDPSRLPEPFRPPSAQGGSDGLPRGGETGAAPRSANGELAAAPVAASIRAVRRPGGGTIFYLAAPRPEDLDRIGDAFLDLRSLPLAPVLLERPSPASPP